MTVTARRVPASRSQRPLASRRAGKDWQARTADEYVETASSGPSGSAGQVTTALHHGLFVAQWDGSKGRLTATKSSWAGLDTEVGWVDELETVKREAVHRMPKVVMHDVSVTAIGRSNVTVQPGHGVPSADVGITALNAQLVRLVTDMARYPDPSPQTQAELARRYGQLREAMNRLRTQFTEAEGGFETAQAMLADWMRD